MITLERSFRRAPGANPDSNAERIPGPWHVKPSGRDGYTQCGKLLRMVSTQRIRIESLEPGVAAVEGKICRTCVVWFNKDQFKAVRH